MEPGSTERPELAFDPDAQRIAETHIDTPSPLRRWGFRGARPSGRELLHQICDGDPLQLEPAALARIHELALLVEPYHVTSKAAARAAFELARDGKLDTAPKRVPEWIERAVDEEADDQRRQAANGIPTMPGEFLRALAVRLGMEAGLIVDASTAFNELPLTVRRVFFGAILTGQSLQQMSDAGYGPPEALERRLRCALSTVSALRPAEVHPDDLDPPELIRVRRRYDDD
ncbi:MAG: hypothetical protein NTV21_06075 [Planctomycetota bacterium]|nr:hypothetical protein [Planctomycetota bacterium]